MGEFIKAFSRSLFTTFFFFAGIWLFDRDFFDLFIAADNSPKWVNVAILVIVIIALVPITSYSWVLPGIIKYNSSDDKNNFWAIILIPFTLINDGSSKMNVKGHKGFWSSISIFFVGITINISYLIVWLSKDFSLFYLFLILFFVSTPFLTNLVMYILFKIVKRVSEEFDMEISTDKITPSSVKTTPMKTHNNFDSIPKACLSAIKRQYKEKGWSITNEMTIREKHIAYFPKLERYRWATIKLSNGNFIRWASDKPVPTEEVVVRSYPKG